MFIMFKSRTLLSGVFFVLITTFILLYLPCLLSSPHPSLHLPPVCCCVSQRSEFWLRSRETETFHCLPRGKWKREKRRPRVQGLLLLFFLFIFFFIVVQTALPGLQLHLWRRPVYQSAASRPLWPLSHQREQWDRKWKRLSDQPPFRLCVRLLSFSSWRQQLLTLLPAGCAAAVRRA